MLSLKTVVPFAVAVNLSVMANAGQLAETNQPSTTVSAEELLAAERWAEAIPAYEALLEADNKNAGNWFNLGRARQHQNQNAEAADAYRLAIANGFQPLVRAQIYLARVLMLLDRRDDALAELEKIGASSGVSFRTLNNIPEFAPLEGDPKYAAIISALTPCNTEEYRQFDFWIGQWDVTSAGSTNPLASNNIAPKHDGCALLEQYVAGAFTGMSVNFYDSAKQKWHQSWISNSGGALYIEGGLNDQGQMVLTDEELPSSTETGIINKITWTPNPDGSVRQFWQTSNDKGKTWTVTFDGLYTKVPEK